ncbi:MAG: sporulation protein YunB [Clostridia bacterium]|nr:sporulation protein YunB [Clostridia bacterium]
MKLKIILLAVFIVVSVCFVIMLKNVSSVLISVSEAAARSYTTVAVSQAVENSLKNSPDYSSLITITRDENGDVADIIANSYTINYIARQTAYLTQSVLNELTSQGVDIPVGAFTGIDALSGFGFKINLKAIPVSAVECRFISKFTSAGINQTLHSLYIQIVSNISIVTPSRTVNVGATDEVLVCESVIVGNIPEYILGGGWLSSGGVLVPQTAG